MEEIKVECCECGKKFNVVKPEHIHIPKFRCDYCLPKRK
jgi:hypothetical protein